MSTSRSIAPTLAAAALAAGVASLPLSAQAIALYSASASATLTILELTADPYSNVIVTGNFNQFLTQGLSSTFSSGNGTASQSSGVLVIVGGVEQSVDSNGDPLGNGGGPQGQTGAYMGIGDSIEQFAEISGSAVGQVASLSFSQAFSTGYIDMFDEYFAGEFYVHLRLDYAFNLQASVDFPGNELASASVAIRLFDGSSVDIITPITPIVSSGQIVDSGTLDLYVPSVFFAQTLTLTVDADGRALAVPEPASLALFASALLGLGAIRRRESCAA